MEPVFVFSIIGGLILILLFAGASINPLKLLGRLFVKVMIGAILLFFLNAFGSSFDIHVPINPATAAVSGLLGLPGIAALMIMKVFILS
ncbi:pro-sigmaK processing inhibitor BofA [Bacillus lacus]|uniref:Pro-sigmaK processing inhibitor BofA n=1 Tax=Metabacillus lacus TaxID=1983721 RepID=A0A7X2J2D8_9BACI|nr:pro-sigmaK processing inhibitor BofA family protein [Metabacillus lacus]MRX74115.1 pro-sigmaK processing inhibitor BofA [Metabacillus lacus]